MNSTDPLDPVWKVYTTVIDCFTVARTGLEGDYKVLLKNTDFLGKTVDEAKRLIEGGRISWKDFVVLWLWATFESQLIEFLKRKSQILANQNPRGFSAHLSSFVESEVEYWKIDDKLELLKGLVGANLVGQAKQIKSYRDWIVHRRKKAATVSPEQTRMVLSEILQHLAQ